MGERFADNSRFLYQYLFSQKGRYGIKRIIWATRNSKIYKFLKNNNYDVIKTNTISGFFLHLKAGVHIICNNASSNGYKKDINTYLSLGAVKIQLWHGVGIKACGKLSRKTTGGLKQKITDKIIIPFFQPGMWGNCFFLATSQENKRIAIYDYGIKPNRVIISQYPRLCDLSDFYLNSEKEIIESIKRKNKIRILYLPTFRKPGTSFTYPTEIHGFSTFLEKNNLLWIQKFHSVDTIENHELDTRNILFLDKDFDVSVLLDCVDLVVTDYSSVSSDAIFKDILTLEYCPDYKEYMNDDRGFVNDFSYYHSCRPILEPNLLFDAIIDRLSKEKVDQNDKRVKDFLFEKQGYTMDDIVSSLIRSFGKHGGVL